MNVHKALAELKIIDTRIAEAIADASFVTANKHSNEKINGVAITEYKNVIKAHYQRVNDLISRRNAMKRAVVISNANTKVQISGKMYTVAEAIEMKNHGMEHFRELLTSMTIQYNKTQYELNQNSGEQLEKRAENYILAMIQAQPKDSKTSIGSETITKLREEYIENNAYDMIDPLNIKEEIQKLSDYIREFETEIDAALSCSNALTEIEFEY